MTKVTISSLLLRLFHRDRLRKQDVVFKMNVLVQIQFEFRQSSVTRDNMGHATVDVTQNVYNCTWWEERVEAVSLAAASVWWEFTPDQQPAR